MAGLVPQKQTRKSIEKAKNELVNKINAIMVDAASREQSDLESNPIKNGKAKQFVRSANE